MSNFTPGTYEIEELFLVPFSVRGREEPIDLGTTALELNLFESLFEKSLTGTLMVRDAFGLQDMLIHRNVFIFIQMKSPDENDENIRHLFYVHDIEQHDTSSQHEKLVKVSFVSFEYIKNFKSRVTSSFVNHSMSGDDWSPIEIFSDLLNSDPPQGVGINGEENDKMPLDINPRRKTFNIQSIPENRINFVSPKWRPFRCMDYLLNRIRNADNSPSYMFFERTDGFMLFNVHEGFEQAQIKKDRLRPYHYNTANLTGFNPGENDDVKYTQIHDMEVKSKEEEIEDSIKGLRGSKLCQFDLLTKRYTESGIDAATEQQKIAQIEERRNGVRWELKDRDILDPKPLKDDYGVHPYRLRPEISGMSKWESLNQRTFFAPVSKNILEYDGKKIVYNEDQEPMRWLQLRHQFLAELELIEYQITALGRFNYHAGDFIRLYIPSTRHIEKGVSAEKIIDEKRSGVYLVVNIRHQFTRQGHFVHMDIARNSLSSKKHFPVGDI